MSSNKWVLVFSPQNKASALTRLSTSLSVVSRESQYQLSHPTEAKVASSIKDSLSRQSFSWTHKESPYYVTHPVITGYI